MLPDKSPLPLISNPRAPSRPQPLSMSMAQHWLYSFISLSCHQYDGGGENNDRGDSRSLKTNNFSMS